MSCLNWIVIKNKMPLYEVVYVESFSLDANGSTSKMYLLTKAPDNQLEKTIITDLIYQPLYITNEITNSLQKNYVRSRTLIHVCRPDGVACVEVQGTKDILGR